MELFSPLKQLVLDSIRYRRMAAKKRVNAAVLIVMPRDPERAPHPDTQLGIFLSWVPSALSLSSLRAELHPGAQTPNRCSQCEYGPTPVPQAPKDLTF